MLYQCLGISGAILLFYGVLTSALTNITNDWFVRGLWILGFLGVLAFVVKSLERIWQKLLVLFLSANLIWILFALGQAWAWYYVVTPLVLMAALFFVLGGFRFSVSVVIATMVTLVLVVWAVASPDFIHPSTLALIAAILLNVSAFILAKKLLHAENKNENDFSKKTIQFVYSAIVLAILIIVNILSQDFHHQWDFTANQINTLSQQSRELLDQLDGKVRVQVFLKQANEARPQMNMIQSLYESYSKNVVFETNDPDVDKMLSQKLNVQDGDVVISSDTETYTTKILSEEGITQGILKVTSDQAPHLCFMHGHGELDYEADPEQTRSLSLLKKGLDNEGYTYQKISGISDVIDPVCEILILAGPQQSITKAEAQAVGSYLASGGRALFLLDPMFTNASLGTENIELQNTGLESVLFDWGIELGKNLILQRTIAMFEGEQIVSQITGFQYGNHPIVDPLKGRQTVFDGVQSVHARPDFEGTTYDLLESFGEGASWTKSDIQALMVSQDASPTNADLLGPVPFVVASEKEGEPKTQLVVFGDADFISNELLVANEFNYDLFLNALGWLSGESKKISIRPKLFQASAIELSETQSKSIFYIAVVFIPMLVLLFGINLWWIRRQRG